MPEQVGKARERLERERRAPHPCESVVEQMLECLQACSVVVDHLPVVEGREPIDEGGIPELRPMTAGEAGRLGVAVGA